MDRVPAFSLGRFSAVAIGSSTGGPKLVVSILSGLPADLPFPLFIAQHLPPTFTPSFAAHLAQASPLTVVHAEDGMPVYPGTVYVGQGHKHMRVVQRLGQRPRIVISPEPRELVFMPSVDELFRSCATVYAREVLAVVLTGIGRDGTEGARAVKQAGGVVLSQNAETCAVYGMPRSCAEAGLSDAVLDPDDIRRAILQLSPLHGHLANGPAPASLTPAPSPAAKPLRHVQCS